MSDGFVALDEEWRFTHVNPTAARFLEKTPQELLGKTIWEVFPETVNSALQANLRQTMEQREPVEFDHFCTTGSLWYEIRCLRVPEGVIVFVKDTTQRKQTLEALRRIEEGRRLALEAAEVGTWQSDLGTQRFVADQRAEMIFALPAGYLTCHDILQIVHPEDRGVVERTMEQTLRIERPGLCRLEYRIALPDSTIRWVAVNCRVHFEGEGTARRAVRLVGTVRDITERKRAELALRKARDELAFLNKELERKVVERTTELQETVAELQHMSYSMIHDMRAPLRAMNSYAALMLRAPGSTASPENQDFLQRIITAADRLDTLLTDALNYNQAARAQLPLGPLDTDALLRGILNTYPQFQAPRADIRIEGTLLPVVSNPGGLTQCISHLLENALKFVDVGRVPRVRIRTEERQHRVRLWIEDNGLGIPLHGQQRIFDMYQQMHVGFDGTGIGLAIVRKLAERMGGRIGVESEPGKGSRFWLEFAAAQPSGGRTMPTALYVEDEENDVFFLRRALERLGVGDQLQVVTDGAEALAYLSGEGRFADRQQYPLPTLLILDLELPRVPGLKVLEWLRQQPALKDLSVVVLSGSGQARDQEQALRMGVLAFLSKSSDAAQFNKLAQQIKVRLRAHEA